MLNGWDGVWCADKLSSSYKALRSSCALLMSLWVNTRSGSWRGKCSDRSQILKCCRKKMKDQLCLALANECMYSGWDFRVRKVQKKKMEKGFQTKLDFVTASWSDSYYSTAHWVFSNLCLSGSQSVKSAFSHLWQIIWQQWCKKN